MLWNNRLIANEDQKHCSHTVFISDLHLNPSHAHITDLFLALLDRHSPSNPSHMPIDALYILGDLFEIWIGDDTTDVHDIGIMNALRAFTEQGIPVYIMHGNRDFLIGSVFMQKTQCSFLPDPSVIDLYGKSVLLMHGDLLCTLDTGYQWFRMLARSHVTRFLFLSLPFSWRAALVRTIRSFSTSKRNKKSLQLTARYDATEAAVIDYMSKHATHLLIHGHTHKPGIHEFSLNGAPAKRIVLGDWGKTGSVLTIDNDFNIHLEIFKHAEHTSQY